MVQVAQDTRHFKYFPALYLCEGQSLLCIILACTQADKDGLSSVLCLAPLRSCEVLGLTKDIEARSSDEQKL